ncbi:MAG: hypothetical protein JNK48_35010 [Bryobacterales bacterium]|nr:hypothetical protein [Bryobacterales bacterium]
MDVLLRIGVALAAGALFRMLVVFGLPSLLSMVALAVAGAALSYRLVASRVFVVLSLSVGNLITYLMTQSASAGELTENPSTILLAMNSAALFLPLAMPAFGSMLLMQYEKRSEKAAAETKELTVESLLAEKVPQATATEIDYDRILASAGEADESPSTGAVSKG